MIFFLFIQLVFADTTCSQNPNQDQFIAECLVNCASLNVTANFCRGIYNNQALEHVCVGEWAQSEVCEKNVPVPPTRPAQPRGSKKSQPIESSEGGATSQTKPKVKPTNPPADEPTNPQNNCDNLIATNLASCTPMTEGQSEQPQNINQGCDYADGFYSSRAKSLLKKSNQCFDKYIACKSRCNVQLCDEFITKVNQLRQMAKAADDFDSAAKDCSNKTKAQSLDPAGNSKSSGGEAATNEAVQREINSVASDISKKNTTADILPTGSASFQKSQISNSPSVAPIESPANTGIQFNQIQNNKPASAQPIPQGSNGFTGGDAVTQPHPAAGGVPNFKVTGKTNTDIDQGFIGASGGAQAVGAPLTDSPSKLLGVRKIAAARAGFDLKPFLPKRAPAADLHSSSSDIWQIISDRYRVKCLLNEFEGC